LLERLNITKVFHLFDLSIIHFYGLSNQHFTDISMPKIIIYNNRLLSNSIFAQIAETLESKEVNDITRTVMLSKIIKVIQFQDI
jgi:ABC-type Zn uptake system ZnuABC Zn-binding protein ZnuA